MYVTRSSRHWLGSAGVGAMAGDDELLRGLGVTARGERELARDVIRDAAGKIMAYEIEWPSNGDSNRIARGNVRAPMAGTELG